MLNTSDSQLIWLQMHGMIYLAVFMNHILNITMAQYSKIIWIY